MNKRLLITGSSGLIGSALKPRLWAKGVEVICLDVRESGVAKGDICDRAHLGRVLHDVDGVIHLAAVSRVIWGEKDPERCWATNVDGLKNVLDLAASAPSRPWVISASSREVYGEPDRVPVTEDFPLKPVNIYGESKAEGERLVERARQEGLKACVIRLSNVFGSVEDHEDRVVPAFAKAAAMGGELRIDGSRNTFDFTYIDDVARGIVSLVDLLGSESKAPPPIHFVTGKPTTLGELARLAVSIAGSAATIREAPSRNFDVSHFYGCHDRASELLGWKPEIPLEEGLARLIQAFRCHHDAEGVVAQELSS